MSDQWGGSPAWNTRWKSLYGGAYSIKTSYVDRYQNTIYLQKFNVDSRSNRNFWGQYMQSVGGALTEGRILYTSFAAIGALDSNCSFLIPVYDDMPRKVCQDPANGDCSYLAAATDKYEYSLSMLFPSLQSVQNAPLYQSCEVIAGYDLRIDAIVRHSYGVTRLEYQWDGSGEWYPLPVSNGGIVTEDISVDFSAESSHILIIRGCAAYDNSVSTKKSNYNFLCAVLYVDVLLPPR